MVALLGLALAAEQPLAIPAQSWEPDPALQPTVERLLALGLTQQAYAELVREASQAPPDQALALELQAGGLFWDEGRWDLAALHFQQLGPGEPSVQLAYAYSLYRNKEPGAALLSLEGVAEGRTLAGFAALRVEDEELAVEHFRAAGNTQLADTVAAWAAPPSRSPGMAAALSAVLPGAGQAYVGRWGEGVSALVVNGLLISSTVALYRRQEWFAGSAVGLLALSFYGGNILSAQWGARRFNRLAKERRVEDLVQHEPRYAIQDGELLLD